MPSPGDVFYAEVEGDRRTWIVVSREKLNGGEYVVAVPCTTKKLEERRNLPNCVPLNAGDGGLPKDCVAQAEMCAVVRLEELDAVPIGRLSEESQRELVKAVGYILGAMCEPE